MTTPATEEIAIIDGAVPWNGDLEARDPADLDLIVLHCTELPTLEDARRAARGSRQRDPEGGGVLGHYYIDRTGRIYRFAGDDRITRHTRSFNQRSIGIELVNRGRYPHWRSSRHQMPTEKYPEVQVDALIDLLRALKRKYPGIRKIARHSDLDRRTAPAEDEPSILVRRRIDPGPLFPWDRILAALDGFEPARSEG